MLTFASSSCSNGSVDCADCAGCALSGWAGCVSSSGGLPFAVKGNGSTAGNVSASDGCVLFDLFVSSLTKGAGANDLPVALPLDIDGHVSLNSIFFSSTYVKKLTRS